MLVLLTISILAATISIWDFFNQGSLKEYFLCKRLELIFLLISVDIFKGVLVFHLLIDHGMVIEQLVMIGLVMVCCGFVRQYKHATLTQYLSIMAFWWLIVPHFFNTIFALSLVILFFTKSLSKTKAHLIIVAVPILSYFVTGKFSLMTLLLIITMLIYHYFRLLSLFYPKENKISNYKVFVRQ